MKEDVLNFQIPPLERSPSAQPCSSVSWEKNGYYAAQDFLRSQTAYLLKLVIPTTNAFPRWRLNFETKTKRTLHSSRRLSFNELTNAKYLVLHSSHFALNWRCCALGERSSGGIWKFRTSSLKCYVDHSHTMYSSGNIDVRNWAHLFESPCILIIKHVS